MIVVIGLAFLLLVLTVPILLRADWQGDNLPDSWESQYGLSTNVYDPADLVGWWQMEPNATNTSIVVDRWTNQINGTMTNFGSSPYVAGLFSNALSFTTNAEVNFPTNNAALNTANHQFTFSGWIQSTNSTGTNTTIAAWVDGQTNSWTVGVQPAGSAFFTFGNAAGTQQTVTPTTGAIQLYDGSWHQVAVTYDINHVATLYVDGQSQANETITNWYSGPEASFSFGVTNSSSTNQPFLMDETRLYDRALGPEEITQLPITYSDLNGSGLSVYEDYIEGLNPLATNTVITSGFVSSGLTSYYGSGSPTLTKTSGDAQTVSASTFEANPLVVQVTDGSGTPLANAPITFSLASGSDGGLSLTSGGTTTSSVSFTTDSSGNATIYYQAGPDVLQNNTIIATAVSQAGSVSVTFTAHCGIQNGLQAWLDADTGVTADGSRYVSQWQDQSAGSNSASQTTSGIQPIIVPSALEGHSVVRFDGSSTYLGMPACIADDFTMVVVFRSNQGAGTNDQWYNAAGIVDASTGSGANDFGLALDANGDLMSGVGNPDTSILSTHGGYNDGQGHIATFERKESTGAFSQFIDSVYQSWQSGNTSTLNAASQITIGSTQTLAQYFGGDVAEVLLFNRTLSHDERHQIEGYLADKYGLYSTHATWPSAYSSDVQTQITANHWSKVQADAYVAFVASNPTVPASGLLVWLKANSGLTADMSGNVEQWLDQSPSGHVLSATSQAGPPVVGTDANGNPTLAFDGDQSVYAPDYIPANGDMTMIVVSSCPNNWSYSTAATVGEAPNTGGQRAYVYSYQTDVFDFYNDSIQGGNSAAVGEEAIHTVTFNRDSGAVNFYLRGVYNGYGNGTAADISNGLIIGQSAGFYNAYFGNISEVLVYNHVLSNSDRQQAEGYIGDKYGIYSPSATWPLAYGADIQALISENEWSKAQADTYVASLSGTVMAPTVSPAPGQYSSSQTVTATSDTTDATIYYTTDGTTPTTSSSSVANGGQINISSTTQLKLMAADGVATNSPVTTAVYQIGNAGQLAAGDDFTMVLKPNGSVWTFGDNGRGEQGDNQAENPNGVPQAVPGLGTMMAIAAAGDHALAVDTTGAVWAWGADDSSQCGDGGTSDLYIPTAISGLSNIVSVYAGQINGFAIDNSGNLYGWGDNSNSQLGDGTSTSQSTPELITSVTNVVKVASSPQFTLALKSDGTVWATGYNGDGELGDGTQNSESSFQQVPNLSNVVDIAVGWGQAVALCSDGTVWTWGYGWDGELGNGNYGDGYFPQQVLGLPPAVAVRAADSKTFVLLADGTVRAFGGNNEGEMGIGNTDGQPSPVEPTGVKNVILLSAGSENTVVCTTAGAFYGWGSNGSFQLTQDFSSNSWTSGLNEIHDPGWQGITSIATGETLAIGLKSDGTVWAVGSGSGGGLGQEDWYSTQRPIQVSNLTGITKIAAGGGGSAYAVDSSGNLWAWGSNWDGQLGIGSYNAVNVATQVAVVSNVTGVSAGNQHLLVLQSDGTVWAAGDDSWGELGDGSTSAEDEPIQVSGFTTAVQVAAGNNTSFVLKSDGTVWAWGENDSGQLGLGNTSSVTTPTQITGLPTMVAISAWGVNGVGIDTSGNVWNWGTLGNSDGTPLEQSGLTGVTAVAAGYYHDLAIKSDGTLWGVGANFENQLGNAGGTNYSIGTFAQLPNVQGAVAIAGCYGSTYFVTEDGSVAGLGNCAQGQLAGNVGPYDYAAKGLFGIGMNESAPTVSLTAPTSGTSETMNYPIQFQASASASTGSITRVDYYLNGVKLGTSTTSGTWNFSWTPTIYGNLTFEAVAVDSAGVRQISAPLTLVVANNTTAPSAPTNVTATSGATGTAYLGWTNGGGATSIVIQEENTDDSWTTLATITNPAQMSYVLSGLTSGENYTFRIVETNANGTSSQTVTYLDSTAASPAFTKVSGDLQSIPSSTFATNPLIVQAKDASGNALCGVPVTFSVASGSDGGLATTNGGSTGSSQTVNTNAQGQATIYYQAGSEVLKTDTIDAQTPAGASTVSVSFTEYGGLMGGLSLWYKADTGVTYDSGDNVSGWQNQSPASGFDLSQTTSGDEPVYVASDFAGNPALHFNGSQWLNSTSDLPSSWLTGSFTMIAVYSAATTGNGGMAFWIGQNGIHNNGAGIGENGSSSLGGTSGGVTAPAGLYAAEEASYNRSASQVTLYSNGVQTTQASASLPEIYGGVTVGAENDDGYTVNWNGDIAEVLLFNHPLSPAELAQIDGYLADKYEYYSPNATWPEAYSSDVQALIAANEWNKSQADAYVALPDNTGVITQGLAVWLKADTGVTSSSGNVSKWVDQVNGQVFVPSGTPQLISSAQNGLPAVQFNGSNDLSEAVGIAASFTSGETIFVVGSTTQDPTSLTAQGLVSVGNSSDYWSFGLYSDYGANFYPAFNSTDAVDMWQASTTQAPSSGTFGIETADYDGKNDAVTLYQDGAAGGTFSTQSSSNLPNNPGMTIGAGELSSNLTGDISEILVYNRPLSSLEVQEVTSYLSLKYGIAYSQYSQSPPTITPDGSVSSSSVSVSFSSAPSGTTIHYTLDGTTPTSSSPTYSGSFSVTQSCPVACAVFEGSTQVSGISGAQFYIADTDLLGISDAWQTEYFGHIGINPYAQSPGGSGLTNLQAYLLGYNPTLYSTNGDGLSDAENYRLGYSATDTDINGYGLTNAQQLALGLDPFNFSFTPPPSPPTPNPDDTTPPTVTITSPQGVTLLP